VHVCVLCVSMRAGVCVFVCLAQAACLNMYLRLDVYFHWLGSEVTEKVRLRCVFLANVRSLM